MQFKFSWFILIGLFLITKLSFAYGTECTFIANGEEVALEHPLGNNLPGVEDEHLMGEDADNMVAEVIFNAYQSKFDLLLKNPSKGLSFSSTSEGSRKAELSVNIENRSYSLKCKRN